MSKGSYTISLVSTYCSMSEHGGGVFFPLDEQHGVQVALAIPQCSGVVSEAGVKYPTDGRSGWSSLKIVAEQRT